MKESILPIACGGALAFAMATVLALALFRPLSGAKGGAA